MPNTIRFMFVLLLVFIGCLGGMPHVSADTIAVIGTGRVGSALEPQFARLGREVIYGSREPERVTTTWVAEEHPERLPWKNPRLVWLYDAFRGRFRSRLYRPMTFYCGSFVKP